MIKVITFDLWDTVFIDDSDEPKREAAGRLSKSEERRELVWKFANKYKEVSKELVNSVYNTSDAAFRKTWHEQFVTWDVKGRLEITFKGLGINLLESEMDEIVKLHEEMELEFMPDFIPGVGDAIKELSKEYKLGVISDAIFSPGRVLRQILESQSLLQHFDFFVFSDEIGNSKPQPIVFEATWNHFGIKPNELVHIGDREHNDILGPKKVGSHSILCTASLDRGSENTEADTKFSNYKELPQILKSVTFE